MLIDKYDYMSAIKADIRRAIEEDKQYWDGYDEMDEDRKRNFLMEELWAYDSVTGNASGSYTFSRYKAEECLAHNMDLLSEAVKEMCDAWALYDNIDSPEWLDVVIRLYLLPQAIDEVLKEDGNETT